MNCISSIGSIDRDLLGDHELGLLYQSHYAMQECSAYMIVNQQSQRCRFRGLNRLTRAKGSSDVDI